MSQQVTMRLQLYESFMVVGTWTRAGDGDRWWQGFMSLIYYTTLYIGVDKTQFISHTVSPFMPVTPHQMRIFSCRLFRQFKRTVAWSPRVKEPQQYDTEQQRWRRPRAHSSR